MSYFLGHHKNIEKWRREDSIKITYKNRPDLIKLIDLTKDDKKIIEDIKDK